MNPLAIKDANNDDLPGILSIYNDIVMTSTAMFSEEMMTFEEVAHWRAERQILGYPVLVSRDEKGVAGYASFGDFRTFSGFRYTIEHSIYVRADCQGRGIGRALMSELFDRARDCEKRTIIAGVSSDNTGSIQFHEELGFVKTAQMPSVGYKFGTWLDLVFLQLDLHPPGK